MEAITIPDRHCSSECKLDKGLKFHHEVEATASSCTVYPARSAREGGHQNVQPGFATQSAHFTEVPNNTIETAVQPRSRKLGHTCTVDLARNTPRGKTSNLPDNHCNSGCKFDGGLNCHCDVEATASGTGRIYWAAFGQCILPDLVMREDTTPVRPALQFKAQI